MMMKYKPSFSSSRKNLIDQRQGPSKHQTYNIQTPTTMNHQTARQKNAAKPSRQLRHADHYDSFSYSSSESSSIPSYEYSLESRRSKHSTQKIKRGAELVKMQIISKSGEGSTNSNSIDVSSNSFVLSDLEDSLNKMNRKEQIRDISPESPRGVTQFESTEVNQQKQSKKQQNKSRHFKLKSILKQGSSFSKLSRRNLITYKAATLEAFPPIEIRESTAFLHAQKAGLLWQTIVGTFVKFPTVWFDGSRSPEMGITKRGDVIPNWKFLSLLRIQDTIMSSCVRDRRSSGKILLHVIITDAEDNEIRDIAIGSFHPKARGVYSNNRYVEQNLQDVLTDDSFRDVWMAVRRNNGLSQNKRANTSSWIERFLTSEQSVTDIGRDSPISDHKKSINNNNVRSVFGHASPKETILLSKENFQKFMEDAEAEMDADDETSPTILLLKKFLYK